MKVTRVKKLLTWARVREYGLMKERGLLKIGSNKVRAHIAGMEPHAWSAYQSRVNEYVLRDNLQDLLDGTVMKNLRNSQSSNLISAGAIETSVPDPVLEEEEEEEKKKE